MEKSYFAEEENWSPGSAGRGPARELGIFYEMMLARGMSRSGKKLLSPQTVEAMIARHRVGMYDHTFKHIIDWGLGFIINSAEYGVETVPYGFGRHASPRTFGHGGRRCCIGFADPEHGLAVAVIFNGTPGEEAHQNRMRQVLSLLYQSLGLSAQP